MGAPMNWMPGPAAPFVIRVAFLTPDAQMSASLLAALTPFGFEVFAADSPAALGAILYHRAIDLCVLHAGSAPEAVLTTVARLRARSTVGIVVLTEAGQTEVRVHALLTGADACVNLPLVARELAAVILGVSRRLGTVSAAPALLAPAPPASGEAHADGSPDELTSARQRQWWLTTDDWVLVSPTGVQLDLSQGERSLLTCFAESPGAVVSRDAIARAIDGAARPVDASDSGTHRISMVVSRLRKKAARAGVRLPFRVVRGTGYEFYERLARANAAMAAA